MLPHFVAPQNMLSNSLAHDTCCQISFYQDACCHISFLHDTFCLISLPTGYASSSRYPTHPTIHADKIITPEIHSVKSRFPTITIHATCCPTHYPAIHAAKSFFLHDTCYSHATHDACYLIPLPNLPHDACYLFSLPYDTCSHISLPRA